MYWSVDCDGDKLHYSLDDVRIWDTVSLPATVEEYYRTCGWEMPKRGTIE